MTIPVWVLLGFATWTLLTLIATVGVYRWIQILLGRTPISSWRADGAQGSDWYRRGMRAHANCVENLPVYGALVVVMVASGVRDGRIDVLAITLMAARVLHTLVHVALPQTNAIAAVRFGFFFTQIVCMVSMAAIIVSLN